jgi:glucokinase
VGVAIAAQLDPLRRRALVAPNLKWQNVRLADDLEKLLKVPVRLENDVRGAAYGELRFGALRGVTGTAASVFWGSGIGGALIAEGRVQAGGLAIAGEIGHLTYQAGGVLCPCGKRGCYEAYVGGHALARRGKMPTRDLFAMRTKLAQQAIAIMGQHIGNIATLIDPDAIVIGGSIGLATFAALKQAVLPHLLVVRRGKLKLVRAKLGDHAGVLGAAVIAASAQSDS